MKTQRLFDLIHRIAIVSADEQRIVANVPARLVFAFHLRRFRRWLGDLLVRAGEAIR